MASIHLARRAAPPRNGSRLAWRLRRSAARAATLAALALMLLPAFVLAANGDWPQFRETQAHQGHNTAETAISDVNAHALGLAWTGATGGAVNSSPAIANGVVYVGSSDGKLYAFAVGCATGGGTCSPIWTANTGAAIDSSPSTSGNRVYVASTNGKLYAFAIGCATGGGTCTPVWTATTGGAIHSSPAISGSVVYVGSNDGKLYAFAVGCASGGGTCTPVWTGTTGGAVESSPAVANNSIYVGSDDGKLYAFAVGCGTGGAGCSPVWTGTTGGAVKSSPSTLNGAVYVGSADGKLYVFDGAGVTNCAGSPTSCTPLWTGTTGGAIDSSPSVGDGRVWVGSGDGTMYAFHATCAGATCAPQWTGATGGAIHSSPASANDVLYSGSNDGKVYAWDADCLGPTCTPAWSMDIGTAIKSSPAVSGGYVYIGSDDGKLYAFHVVVDHLVLSPATATIVAGAHQAYTAEGFDAANGDLGDYTASTVFTIDNGGSCSGTQCGATAGGVYTVTGTYQTATGQATLTVSSTGATYVAIDPVRLLDTRVANGLSGVFTSGVPRTFQVTGRGGVPSSAVAVTGNLTVTAQTSAGFLFVGPVAQVVPATSTLNFPKNDNRANGVTVALGVGGDLSVTFRGTTNAHTHVVFDVTGYFLPDATGATYFPLSPTRILDTRIGTGLSGVFTSHVPRTFQVTGVGGVDASAVAVTGNLTVTEQSSNGFLFIGPNAIASPTSSTLNFPKGDNRANNVTVALGAGGTLSITFAGATSAHTQVVFDVTGYFKPGMSGATYVALDPSRILDTRVANGLSGVFTSGTPRTFQVTGRGGVPSTAGPVAITGNLTVTGQTSLGYLFIGPTAVAAPTSSTLNFPKNDNRANGVDVALGAGGTLSVTFKGKTGTHTQVVFDVTGYFTH